MPSVLEAMKQKKVNEGCEEEELNQDIKDILNNAQVSKTPPSHDYVELISIQNTATNGNKEKVTFQMINNKVRIESGNIGCISPLIREYEHQMENTFLERTDRDGKIREKLVVKDATNTSELFDLLYANYIDKRQKNGGCISVSTKKTDKIKKQLSTGFKVDYNPDHGIIEDLLTISRQFISERYTISVDNIAPEKLKAARNLLSYLGNEGDNLSVANFNRILQILYTIIPRAIPNLRKELCSNKYEYSEKIKKESEMLDTLEATIKMSNQEPDKTFCEAYNLDIKPADEQQIAEIKDLMGANKGSFVKAWAVDNKTLTENQANYIAQKGYDENTCKTTLFHGSGAENIVSLLGQGPLDPHTVDAVLCAWALGPGFYMGTCAAKSMGYTRAHGESRAFLIILECVTEEIYDIARENKGVPNSESDLLTKHPNADVLWSYAGVGENMRWRYDEVVAFGDNSIHNKNHIGKIRYKYLVEYDPSCGRL